MKFSAGFLLLMLIALPSAESQLRRPLAQIETQSDIHRGAETQTHRSRLRIGVALEGGGALGLAHIGVLQWFEEHHIPVDYLAGTSMGGLVGGIYATGMHPSDLRKLVDGLDWHELLTGSTPYEDLSFRRKQDERAYQTPLVLGLREGFSLRSGLKSGQQITLFIDELTLAYHSIESFDDLPTAFRCVGTDLVSGNRIVFSKGSLPLALRATISLPGFFTPVRTQDQVLVDGGVLDNLPTDVVRTMGADIVIAVHLETKPVTPRDIRSGLNVLSQSVRVAIAESEERGMAQADVVLSVPLGGYGAMDYHESESIMEIGYRTAQTKEKLLERFALSENEWEDYLHDKESRIRKAAPIIPQFIRVEGTDWKGARDIEGSLASFVGVRLVVSQLDRELTRLTGRGPYEAVTYQIKEENGEPGLLIRVTEKTYAPPLIQTSFLVNGAESESVSFTAGARLTVLDVAGPRSEWRTDFSLGGRYGVASELYKPVGESRWFIAPWASAGSGSFDFYSKVDPVALYWLREARIGIDLGYAINRFSELRTGYEVGYLDATLRLGEPEFPPVNGGLSTARLHYVTDHTDDPVVPRNGYRAETNFHWYTTSPGASGAFPSLSQTLEFYRPTSAQGSVLLAGSGGSTFGSTNTGIPQFFLGGTLRLSAYGLNELRGNQYYYCRAGYLHDLWTLPSLLGGRVYAAGIWEFGKMYGASNESTFPTDVAVGMVAKTALGPMLIGASAGDTGHYKWFFQIGHGF